MPKRQSRRLPGYDYTEGAFFITINTHGKIRLFGKLENDAVSLDECGELLKEEWLKTAAMRPNLELDVFQIMPTHFHAIIFLYKNAADKSQINFTQKLEHLTGKGARSGSLGTILGLFKGAVTRKINATRNTPDLPVWEDDYYERIIRNYSELQRIRQYIIDNPKRKK